MTNYSNGNPELIQSRLGEFLAQGPLIPVITLEDAADAVPLARALVAGGLSVLEFTLRTSAGAESLRQVREAMPNIHLAAGTVRNIDEYHQAIWAGADFVVSPGSTSALLNYGVTAEVPLLPGVSTVTEVMHGYEKGYRWFKLFPASLSGGVEAVRAIRGPFPDVQLVPTGGIGRDTAADYLAEPGVAAVGGTWLSPSQLIRERDWKAVERLAAESLSKVSGLRSQVQD